jgi:hypothetical protein
VEAGEAGADEFGTSVVGGGVEMVQGSRVSLVSRAAGTRPWLSAAAMARATQVFPEPGSPESMAKVPAARRSCQSHSMGRWSMSAR